MRRGRNKVIIIRIFIVLGLLAVLPVTCGAAEVLTLERTGESYEFARNVEILEDPGQGLTLSQVMALDGKGFEANPHGVISIGRSDSAFWFRFRLTPASKAQTPAGAQGCKWLLEVAKQGIGALDLYVPVVSDTGSSRYQKTEFGTWRPPSSRHIPARTSVTALPATWDGQSWFYLRVKSDVSINFALRIHSTAGYIKHMLPDLYGFGILFGILAGMLLYNLCIYLYLQDLTYLLYVLYIFSLFWFMTLLYGHFELVFHPDPTVMRICFFAASGCTWFFGGAFGRLFLNTKTYAPVLDKIILTIMLLSLGVPALAFAGFTYLAHQLNPVLGITFPPIAILAALRVWQKGFAPAKYYLAAWLGLVLGITLYSIGGTLIPRTPVTIYTFAVGAGAESILLSLALADRIRLLQKEKEALRLSAKRFRAAANTDPMTGLFNRRYLKDILDREVPKARKDHTPLSLLMMDVDNFKRFNDTFGHPEGDRVLQAMAEVLFQQIREQDIPCRYGGEEFVVVLPNTGMTAATGVAQRIRETFVARTFRPKAQDTGHPMPQMTVSIGVAKLTAGEKGAELIQRADKALYRAKAKGKNRVVSG